MRPRISRKEAQYIVDVLKQNTAQLQQKRLEIQDLESEVAMLKDIIFVQPYNACKLGLREKQDRLAEIKQLTYDIYIHLQHHAHLIAKYQAIADGLPHDGRYKKLSVCDDFWQKIHDLETTLSVNAGINPEQNEQIREVFKKVKPYVPGRNYQLALAQAYRNNH